MGSRRLPSDRTPTRDAQASPDVTLDYLALRVRDLSDAERAEEAALVRRRIGRVVVRDDPHETQYTRALLRHMLLGGES